LAGNFADLVTFMSPTQNAILYRRRLLPDGQVIFVYRFQNEPGRQSFRHKKMQPVPRSNGTAETPHSMPGVLRFTLRQERQISIAGSKPTAFEAIPLSHQTDTSEGADESVGCGSGDPPHQARSPLPSGDFQSLKLMHAVRGQYLSQFVAENVGYPLEQPYLPPPRAHRAGHRVRRKPRPQQLHRLRSG
jgi:hypothetical protein